MVAFVMAYSFTEPTDKDESLDDDEEEGEVITQNAPMMVPLADILNHVAKNNAHLKFEKEALKMVATKSIKKVKHYFTVFGQCRHSQTLLMCVCKFIIN